MQCGAGPAPGGALRMLFGGSVPIGLVGLLRP
jgi:hypothetical protein